MKRKDIPKPVWTSTGIPAEPPPEKMLADQLWLASFRMRMAADVIGRHGLQNTAELLKEYAAEARKAWMKYKEEAQ